jgi:hypothetical protein
MQKNAKKIQKKSMNAEKFPKFQFYFLASVFYPDKNHKAKNAEKIN